MAHRIMANNQGFGIGGVQTVLLSLLSDRPRHAYELAKEVKRLSEESLPFHFGTLYPALYRLEREGFVTSLIEHPEGERQRRVYELTEKGKAEAERLQEAWNVYARAMDRIVNPQRES